VLLSEKWPIREEKVLKKKEWVNEPAASGIKVELSPVFLL